MLHLSRTDTTIVIDLHPSPSMSIAVDEPLPVAIRRLSLTVLDGAVDDLHRAVDGDLDASVHGARKKLKRARAILRLIRDDLGQATYRNENVVLRDTARTLGAMRDAHVLILSLRALRERYGDLLDPDTFSTTEAFLIARYGEHRAALTNQVCSDAVVNVAAARSRFASYPLADRVPDDYAALAPGIHRVYRRGHRGFHRSETSRSIEDLHEWRKRVKYLRHQMEALEQLQPGLIGAIARELEDLGEVLGQDHDLAVLADTVMAEPDACRDERERWLLASLIHADRGHLQARAMRAGTALYTEKPNHFVDRIGAYWTSART